jgi:hypothetical protein
MEKVDDGVKRFVTDFPELEAVFREHFNKE